MIALMWTAQEGHLDIAKLLLDAGADTSATDDVSGPSPCLLPAARCCSCCPVLLLLLVVVEGLPLPLCCAAAGWRRCSRE